jgi:hypothetical protein
MGPETSIPSSIGIKGHLATIGRKSAVVSLKHIQLNGFFRLVVLECCPHLFPAWRPEQGGRGNHLAVGIPYLAAGRPLDQQI